VVGPLLGAAVVVLDEDEREGFKRRTSGGYFMGTTMAMKLVEWRPIRVGQSASAGWTASDSAAVHQGRRFVCPGRHAKTNPTCWKPGLDRVDWVDRTEVQ
jgi:hypothetical protein